MWRAEYAKLRTTRTAPWLWVIAIVVVIVGNYSTVSSVDAADLTGNVRDQNFHLVAAVNLSLIAVLVGVRSITDEYRYDTISWTVLTQPHRRAALGAKAIVAGLLGVMIGLTAQVVGLAVALLAVSSKGAALDVDAGDARAVAGLSLAAGILTVIGVAVGALIRNQLIAVALTLVWMLAVENIGSAVLGGAGEFLPGQAARALGGTGDFESSPLVAAATLSAYAVLLLAVAARDFDRRPMLQAS